MSMHEHKYYMMLSAVMLLMNITEREYESNPYTHAIINHLARFMSEFRGCDVNEFIKKMNASEFEAKLNWHKIMDAIGKCENCKKSDTNVRLCGLCKPEPREE